LKNNNERLREIEDRKMEILMELTHLVDNPNKIVQLNNEYVQLDDEYYQLKIETIRAK
jgi:hypothetical protein